MENWYINFDTINYFNLGKILVFCWKIYFLHFHKSEILKSKFLWVSVIYVHFCNFWYQIKQIIHFDCWYVKILDSTWRIVAFVEPKFLLHLKMDWGIWKRIHFKLEFYLLWSIFHLVWVKIVPCPLKYHNHLLRNS